MVFQCMTFVTVNSTCLNRIAMLICLMGMNVAERSNEAEDQEACYELMESRFHASKLVKNAIVLQKGF